MSCQGCDSPKLSTDQMALVGIRVKAKKFATEINENVVIYKNEEGYGYSKESAFRIYRTGQPVEGIVPELQRTHDG